jgi:hypothetical protein
VKKRRKRHTAEEKGATLSRCLLEQKLIVDGDPRSDACVRVRPNIVFFEEKE